jgi:hypothetical protein
VTSIARVGTSPLVVLLARMLRRSIAGGGERGRSPHRIYEFNRSHLINFVACTTSNGKESEKVTARGPARNGTNDNELAVTRPSRLLPKQRSGSNSTALCAQISGLRWIGRIKHKIDVPRGTNLTKAGRGRRRAVGT